MNTTPGMFQTKTQALRCIAWCLACIAASLVIAGMLTWCLWQIIKAVH